MDSTEQARRELVQEVNQDTERAKLEEKYGELMTTSMMCHWALQNQPLMGASKPAEV